MSLLGVQNVIKVRISYTFIRYIDSAFFKIVKKKSLFKEPEVIRHYNMLINFIKSPPQY